MGVVTNFVLPAAVAGGAAAMDAGVSIPRDRRTEGFSPSQYHCEFSELLPPQPIPSLFSLVSFSGFYTAISMLSLFSCLMWLSCSG
mgnify:CR=1 FL=1